MIITKGLLSIDLGLATAMTLITKEKRQMTMKTGGGADYTLTWSFHEQGGYKFYFEYLEKSLFEDFENFVMFDAEGSRNKVSVTLDDGSLHNDCYFIDKGNISAGELETIGTVLGVINVYKNIYFSIKFYD